MGGERAPGMDDGWMATVPLATTPHHDLTMGLSLTAALCPPGRSPDAAASWSLLRSPRARRWRRCVWTPPCWVRGWLGGCVLDGCVLGGCVRGGCLLAFCQSWRLVGGHHHRPKPPPPQPTHARLAGLSPAAAKQQAFIASMGIYVFKKSLMLDLLDKVGRGGTMDKGEDRDGSSQG